MLDTNARKFVTPFIKYGANFFIKLNLNPNHITLIALITGILSSICLYFDLYLLSLLLLWLSGYLDAVDGEVARATNSMSLFGTLMDITFDRFVEICIIVVCALKYPSYTFYLLLLSCSIILCMVVFLSVGALSTKSSQKTFYYQPGIMERSETFILLSSMILFKNHVGIISIIFTILVIITTIQRFLEAYKILKN